MLFKTPLMRYVQTLTSYTEYKDSWHGPRYLPLLVYLRFYLEISQISKAHYLILETPGNTISTTNK